MAKKVVKDQPNKEKLIILLETLDYDVDKFKFEKYQENKKDPLLCKKLSGSYADMCKAQTMATVTTLEDYDMVNPFYYHSDWKNKIQYIEDAKSKHLSMSQGSSVTSFRDLHAHKMSKDAKESIMRNIFDIWTKEHESDMELRKHYYEGTIDSINNKKLKGGLLRLKDILIVVFLIFAIFTVTNPYNIPTFFGILPFFRNIAININQSMITTQFISSILIFAIYVLAFGVIATVFFNLARKEYYSTFKNKKKSKKRFARTMKVAEIKQRAAIKTYIKRFVNSPKCPSTKITDIVLVQNAINGYDYFYSEMGHRYGWMEENAKRIGFLLSIVRLASLITILVMFGLV